MSETILRVGPTPPPKVEAPPLLLTRRGTCGVCGHELWRYVTDPDAPTRTIGWRCAGCGSLIRNDEAIGLGRYGRDSDDAWKRRGG